MSELIVILNVLVILGMVVSAIMAVHFEKLLSTVIALGVTGLSLIHISEPTRRS